MKSDKRNYVIVGTFVITMVVALIVWIMLMAGRTGATDDYFIVYENVSQLKTGVKILYEGFPVGLIEEIEPVDREGKRHFRVDVSVKRGWPIPEDSRAAIATGLFSSAVIDIRAGEAQATLAPGSEIPSQEATDVMAAVNAAANQLTTILDGVADRVPRVFDDVEQFTGELNTAMDQINAMLDPENVQSVKTILANVERATSGFDALLANLEGTRKDVDSMIKQLDRLLDEERGEVSKAIDDLRHSLAAVARHIDATTANLEATTRNLDEFSRQIRENPGVLIRGRETDDGA
jgi:phospholipid/cholesterol/gamma-HCH transport system substrate-binding protein